jgi:hypothetical protein
MNIDYAGPIKKAFGFCIQPKRWLPFFILDLAFAAVGLSLILSNSMTFLLLMTAPEAAMSVSGEVAVMILELIGLFAVWLLATLWITGAVIHQSHKEKEFKKGWTVSRQRYLPLIGVSIVTAVIGGIAGMIPFVGWVISIIVGLIFFFALQGVMIKEEGVMKSLEDSWHIFKHQPFKVFLIWLLIAALSFMLIIAFALPILALTISVFLSIAGTGGTIAPADLINVVNMIQTQFPLFAAAGIIAILGFAIVRAMSIKAQTEFYLQFRKAK